MAITTFDGIVGAAKQNVVILKTGTRTLVAQAYAGLIDVAGVPGAGTLAGASTAAGIVPTDATAGHPTINAFGGGATGYIGVFRYSGSVAGRLRLDDVLFKAGAYAYNASTTLASQPSYSSRVPGGTDFKGLEIWVEAVTAFTGTPSVAVTYTNQDGTTGRTTGTVSAGAALIVGRRFQLPLQAGDTGVQKIESVTGSVATAGTFNVLVLRPLIEVRVPLAGYSDVLGPDRTGLPQVFADSALELTVAADSTAVGLPYTVTTIING